MSDNTNDNRGPTDRVTAPAKSSERRLTDIVREVKIAAAERSDVVVDMRDADRARLELLAEELASVIEDINPADDRFDFGISTGQQPRFWIDAGSPCAYGTGPARISRGSRHEAWPHHS